MPRWGFHARTIVENDAAQKSAVKLGKQFERFDEALDALYWLLARSCDKLDGMSREVDGVYYHLLRRAGDSVAETPDIIVLYTFDEDEVVIFDVNAEESQNGE